MNVILNILYAVAALGAAAIVVSLFVVFWGLREANRHEQEVAALAKRWHRPVDRKVS